MLFWTSDRPTVAEALVVHEEVSRQLFDEAVRGLPAELCTLRGWTIHSATFPTLDMSFSAPGRAATRLRVQCDDWNSLPPSIVWLDEQGNLAKTIAPAPGNQFQQAHSVTGRPFVCMAGVREYHTHSSHTGDLWDNYKNRSGYDLGDIITQVWRAWQTAKL
jgi:hypothetical protein